MDDLTQGAWSSIRAKTHQQSGGASSLTSAADGRRRPTRAGQSMRRRIGLPAVLFVAETDDDVTSAAIIAKTLDYLAEHLPPP